MMDNIKLFLVDDHKLIRDGLKSYFESDDKFSVIGEAYGGHEALVELRKTELDVLVTDMVMPGMDGIQLVRALKEEEIACKIIVLTMQSEPQHIREVLGYGVEGYLLKCCSEAELKKAVSEVYNGNQYYSPEVTTIIMNTLSHKPKGMALLTREMPLTKREIEVLHLIVKQYTNHEIAEELFISMRTVDAHKRNLIEKTGARNVAGLVLYALEKQLFTDV